MKSLTIVWIIYIEFCTLLLLTHAYSIDKVRKRDLIQAKIGNILNLISHPYTDAEYNQIYDTCQQIKNSISSASEVNYPVELLSNYASDIYHYGLSSSELSVCSVEPGTTTDVATIMKIIRKTRVPFAVKSGGHSTNPGFSSTWGVLIAMKRFSKITYHPNNQTVDLGPGLTWDQVYKGLEPYNVNVIGGRVSGVGVGGFVLGGGYGWKTNQYGLTIDTVREYELVTPYGDIVYINKTSNPDLFFALKGGLNNFGIVTNFNLDALPQTQVYGGFLTYTILQFDQYMRAAVKFVNNNKDPKAQIITSLTSKGGLVVLSVIIFYDAPTAPADMFKDFTDIFPRPTGILQTRSFLSLVQATPVFLTSNMRVRFNAVSITNVTEGLMTKLKEMVLQYALETTLKLNTLISFSVEPFLPTYLDHSQGGAYPHDASTPIFPIVIEFGWISPLDDDYFINKIKTAAATILQTVLNEGQNVGGAKQILYTNYALENATLVEIYGSNVERLRSIREKYDPEKVMNRAGGFKF